MKNKLIALLMLIFIHDLSYAVIFYEISIESGGEKLVRTNIDGFSINAGGGTKYAIGYQDKIKDNSNYKISLGYLSESFTVTDSLTSATGDVEIATLTLDSSYIYEHAEHRFGGGLSYHINPKYKENVNVNFDLDFDGALGLTLDYAYSVNDKVNIGVRYTSMTYKDERDQKWDATSTGLFISNGF